MSRLAIALLLSLSACAIEPAALSDDPVVAQCQYEASAATANTPGILASIYEYSQLFQRCMRAKGRQ